MNYHDPDVTYCSGKMKLQLCRGGIIHASTEAYNASPGVRKNGLVQQTLVALHVALRPTCLIFEVLQMLVIGDLGQLISI